MNRSWTVVGYFGAAVLSAVSLIANLRYGLSLARHPLDQATYAGASVAIDLLKALLPVVALRLWGSRHRLVAIASAILWLGCLSWSLSNAIGFSLATRAEVNAERGTEKVAHAGWVTTVDRAERQLSALGNARPAAVVKADLAAANVSASVWARTKECTAITLPESYAACAAVVSLRRELAVAEVAERLEQSLAAGHAELRADKTGQAEIDPQATALALLAGVDKSSIRTGLASTSGRGRGGGLCTGLHHRRLGHQGRSSPFYGPSGGKVSTDRGPPSHGSLAPQTVQAAQRRDRHPEP